VRRAGAAGAGGADHAASACCPGRCSASRTRAAAGRPARRRRAGRAGGGRGGRRGALLAARSRCCWRWRWWALSWWAVRRRAPAGIVARGRPGIAASSPPPPHLPFGDPATQPSAAGFGQPLRRMLGTSLLAAREGVTMPPPGDTAPARLEAGFADPALVGAAARPLPRWRDARRRRPSGCATSRSGRCLGLTFGAGGADARFARLAGGALRWR
jgi:hypothetical protein